MNKHRFFMVATLTVGMVALTGCDGSADEANATEEEPATEEVSSEENQAEKKDTAVQESGEESDQKNLKEQSPPAEKEDTESPMESNSDSTGMSKEEYLKKLNDMEDADRHEKPGKTMLEMEKQEEERFRKWDDELNLIYTRLKEELEPEAMEKLREEQREWVLYRDETAKESSLKYEGGSTETLEYVATQAELTRERCYALVAKYMN